MTNGSILDTQAEREDSSDTINVTAALQHFIHAQILIRMGILDFQVIQEEGLRLTFELSYHM